MHSVMTIDLDAPYTISQVAEFASVLPKEYALTPGAVSNFASRFGHAGGPFEPIWVGGKKRVRQFTLRQTCYFAVVNMLTCLHGYTYNTAIDILERLIEYGFLERIIERREGVGCLIIYPQLAGQIVYEPFSYQTRDEFFGKARDVEQRHERVLDFVSDEGGGKPPEDTVIMNVSLINVSLPVVRTLAEVSAQEKK